MTESEGFRLLSDGINGYEYSEYMFLYKDIVTEIIGPYWEHYMSDRLWNYDPVNYAQWEVHGM